MGQRHRPRVLHIIPTLTTGGAERLVVNLLGDPQVDASIICLYELGTIGLDAVANGDDVTVLGMDGWRKPLASLRLAVAIRRLHPEVVHVHLLSAQLWGIPAARLARVPVVVSSEHSLMADSIEGRPLTWWLRLLYLILARAVARTIAVSAAASDRLQDWGVPADRIVTIDNGIDTEQLQFDRGRREQLRGELGIPAHAPVVGGVGRLDPVKRLDVLIQLVACMSRRGQPVHAIIVGSGDLETQLRTQAEHLNLTPQVHVLGPCLDVSGPLSAMDILISPSRDETFGMAIVEALLNGLPVAYEQCPAIDGLDARIEGAHLVDPDLPTGIELDVLAEIVGHSACPSSRSSEAPAVLTERYGLESFRRRTRDLYGSLL